MHQIAVNHEQVSCCHCPCHKSWFTTDPIICICSCNKTNSNVSDFTRIFEGDKKKIDDIDKRVKDMEGLRGIVAPALDKTLCALEERIKSLETLVKAHEQYLTKIHGIALCDPDKVLSNQKLIMERLSELEEWTRKEEDNVHSKIKSLAKWMTDHEKEGLEKRAFKCPVCDGQRKIQVHSNIMEPFEKRDIDSLGRHFVNCVPCEGKGIVWG